jgi:hypothetical protein
MNDCFKFFLLLAVFSLTSSCNQDKDNTEPLRDYAVQYADEAEGIDFFLKNNTMSVIHNPGNSNDMDVNFTKITNATTEISIWDQTNYPLLSWQVVQNNVTYTLYYIKLREGSLTDGKSPCNVDNVLTAYKGQYLRWIRNTTTNQIEDVNTFVFEENLFPQSYFGLASVIKGWNEIYPKFKSGTYVANSDGTITYENFGAGIMFIPSGLAYYAQRLPSIPPYSPLIFNFKLYEVQRLDQDNDGIPSYLEDRNNDGYFRILSSGTNPDDTDGDGRMDYTDSDDDGDGITTKFEIKNPLTNLPYPFEEIPTCPSGTLKKYLDPNCN